MLKSFKVTGLNGSLNHDLQFHPDLNIVTGRNGSGKTSLLKLLWYMFSGNIERTIREIEFKTASLHGRGFSISIDAAAGEAEDSVEVKWKVGKAKQKRLTIERQLWENDNGAIDKVNNEVARISGESLFLPTFRRIEGGFSVSERRRNAAWRQGLPFSMSDALQMYSDSISVYSHNFITTISTDDIERLLTKQLADISEETNRLHLKLSKFILESIDHSEGIGTSDAVEISKKQETTLRSIRKEVNIINESRDRLMAPISMLTELIKGTFQHKGIALTKNITFGDSESAVKAAKLSAGEKQMLSFLCYNASLSSGVIIIDEPEISLHADWQRILFPTLLNQAQNNQFIVATHSPMIYSKYPQNELVLNEDRGDE